MKNKKIITFILIIAWMILLFCFSNQNREQSSEVSEKVTEITSRTLNIQIEKQGQKLETKIRKLTHCGLYTIGGILILTHINLYDISLKKKILLTQIIGTSYAIFDEYHQTFVMGRSGEILDVLIDLLGVLTGLLIVILLLKIRKKE